MAHLTPRIRAPFIRVAALGAVALAVAAACSEQAPTAIAADAQAVPAPVATLAANVVPILAEPLTARHTFTDDIAVQLRVKPAGRPTEVVNLKDGSNSAVVRFTIQPGVRFPWHSHPGLVMVSVTQGSLTFVYADDCVARPYPAGTAFVDPGFGNVHYAFNPTEGETIIVATFLGLPPAPAPLTNPVDAATAAMLDAKCQVGAAMGHAH